MSKMNQIAEFREGGVTSQNYHNNYQVFKPDASNFTLDGVGAIDDPIAIFEPSNKNQTR